MILLTAASSLCTNSCSNFKLSSQAICCTGLEVYRQDRLTADRHSQGQNETVESALIGLRTRFDNKAIVLELEVSPERWDVFNSTDGGDTWHHDEQYRRIYESWLPGASGHQETIDWLPHPASEMVRYRTIKLAPGEFSDERSADGGKTWTLMNFNLLGCQARLRISELNYYYHPRDPMKIYIVATLPWRKGGSGMFVSSDGGDNFAFMCECYGTKPILAISPSNPQVMYASAVMGNIAKSIDGGRIWKPVGQADLMEKVFCRDTAGIEMQISDIEINPANPNTTYLVANKRILRTQDGGETWCLLDTDAIGSIGNVAVPPTTPNLLLAGASKGLFRSADAGCHWERIDVKSRIVSQKR